jgi:hypothetical protein
MPKSHLSERLEAGNIADIFYDARDYEDHKASDVINDFQQAVSEAATHLSTLAGLDLTAAGGLSDQDLETLRTIQASIRGS